MYKELSLCDSRIDDLFSDRPQEVFGWLIGRPIKGLTQAEMYSIWCISGKYICKMYRLTCVSKDRAGVG